MTTVNDDHVVCWFQFLYKFNFVLVKFHITVERAADGCSLNIQCCCVFLHTTLWTSLISEHHWVRWPLDGFYLERNVAWWRGLSIYQRAREHVLWTNGVISDESRFSLQSDSRRVVTWKEPDLWYNLTFIREFHQTQGTWHASMGLQYDQWMSPLRPDTNHAYDNR